MKYPLIRWISTNETSILTSDFVRDKTMLDDPTKQGMVMFGQIGIKPPKSCWKSYLARVVATSGKIL